MSTGIRREYQDPCNTLGYVTASQIGITGRNAEPCRHIPPPRTSIYDRKAVELVMKNPLPVHDNFLTTAKDVFHQQKYYDSKYEQPHQPLAPGLEKILYIKPDYSHKMETKNFNPKPIYDRSETKDAFKARHPIPDLYGGPVPSDPVRDVYVSSKKDYVYEFNRDEPSIIRAAHPYFPTSRYVHRLFSEEELRRHRTMNAITGYKPTDVAIKLRIRPMEGPFEQNEAKASRQKSMDQDRYKWAPAPREYSSAMKYFFRKPLYKGCPPRVFKPVPRLGWAPLTKESYEWPFHCFNKENHTSAFSLCRFQPKQTMAEVSKIPNMYKTESQTYGSGKHVAASLDILSGPTRDYANNTIGEQCCLY